MSEITVRKATELDMENIFMLQISVFEGEQGIPAEDVPVGFESSPQFWCVEDGDKIVGGITAWMEDYDVHMGRFAIAPQYRGQHIGTRLLKLALDTLFAQGARRINMEARDSAVKIALDMGAEITGEPNEFYGANVTPLILEKEKYNPKY